MKKKIIGLCLSALLTASSLSLASCAMPDISAPVSQGLSEEEVKSIVDSAVSRALTDAEINREVNNYEITVTGDTSSLDAVRPSLLSAASVVCKYVEEQTVFNPFTRKSQTSTEETAAAGAAVIFRLDKEAGDAYLITNYHVVYNDACNTPNHISDNISVYLFGQELADYAIPATYVGGSMNYDLAVLRVSNNAILRASDARAVTFADSDGVCVLDTAVAIGNPKAKGISATVGHVNVPSEYISMTGADNVTPVEFRVMRIDTPVNNGNSGGGLFNDRGELIGIVNAKIIDSTVDDFGYAIPSNIVKNVAENILYYCADGTYEHPQRLLLGVTVEVRASHAVLDSETGRVSVCETIGVREVSDTAVCAGKILAGDEIRSVTLGGVTTEVTRMYQVIDRLLAARIGDTVTLTVVRNGETLTVPVLLTEAARAEVK